MSVRQTSARKQVVEQYFEGFRRSDHQQVLACLTDDVVWDLPGYRHLEGKEAFDGEIENEQFEGSPTLVVDRLVEEADAVVAVGSGESRHRSGARHRFAFTDVFTFRSDRICRVESYLVPLAAPSSPVVLHRAVPVLASLDLEATHQFYRDRLGFSPVSRYPNYAVSARQGIEIHFWLTEDPQIPRLTSCRIDVTGVDELYREMSEQGVVHPNGQLREQPWGIKEFTVLDGDGNTIRFGERRR